MTLEGKILKIMNVLDDTTNIKEMAAITAAVMGAFNDYDEPQRFGLLFNYLAEQDPESLDEFTLRFAERNTEKEDQDNG